MTDVASDHTRDKISVVSPVYNCRDSLLALANRVEAAFADLQ